MSATTVAAKHNLGEGVHCAHGGRSSVAGQRHCRLRGQVQAVARHYGRTAVGDSIVHRLCCTILGALLLDTLI